MNFVLLTILVHFDTTACSVASIRLVHEETLHGRGRSPRPPIPYTKRFARDFCGSLLNMASFLTAALYAHVTICIHISGYNSMAAFTITSIILKIALQEAAKRTIFRKNVHSVAIMAAFIGLPTILIHTHVSIIMLRAQQLSTTISGSMSAAVLEIAMRVGKALQSGVKPLHRIATITAATAKNAGAPRELSVKSYLSNESMYKKLDHDQEFFTWKTQLLHYYVADIYVDMFAEYVAMGCSYAILVIFWNHPMFRLSYRADYDAATSTLSQSLFKTSRISALIFQAGLEIVVDFVACVFETTQGINMQSLHAHNIYLTFFLVWAAVGNITIGAHVFFLSQTTS